MTGANGEATTAGATISIAPVSLPLAGRGIDLELKVSAPIAGSPLPVILFSHGNGHSLHSYGPLVDHWASHGFAVIQPTHLDARALDLAADDPRRPQLWQWRERDLLTILDRLDEIAAAVPAIGDRLDRERIAIAGHSWGAQTASTFLGATHPDPQTGGVVRNYDPRIAAGVLLAVPGSGDGLSAFAAQSYPFMHPDFSAMTTPALVVYGDAAKSGMTTQGPEWWRGAYDLSPSPKSLLTMHGGQHSLGGLPGYEARETTDERPERVAVIRRLSTAFLQSVFNPGSRAWDRAVADLHAQAAPEGSVETK